MKIPTSRTRTRSNPLNGVTFDEADNEKIVEIAKSLSGLPSNTLLTIRRAIAREIVWLEEISDWTEEQADKIRTERLSEALLTYQATFTARLMRQIKPGPTEGAGLLP